MKMKKKVLLAMLAVALVFGMTLAGCNDSGSGTATLEGSWSSVGGASMGYQDYYFTFTGNDFTWEAKNSAGATVYSEQGTFTSTATEITFIPEMGSEFTQGYTLSGNKLTLANVSGSLCYGTFTKQ